MTESIPAANDSSDIRQLSDRVLAWILTVRSAKDLSAQNIEKQTGLKFWHNPNNADDFGASGELTAPWTYTLRSMATLSGPAPHPVRFEVGVTGNKDADMTPVCIEFDRYRQALTDTGFELSQHPPRSGVEYRYFKNEKVRVGVYLRGKTKRHDKELCIFKVIVGAAPRQE